MDITNGVDMSRQITEGIEFGDLISKNEGMWLVERSAPTPSEKEIIEPVAFMQGVHDFSMMMGERVFENRPITYTFHIFEREKSYRKFDQTQIENNLMRKGITILKDTYSEGYYYLGKCVSVDTEDDHVYGRLIVTIEFNCYPFKIKEAVEGSPYWDDYDISDYYQEKDYTVSGTKTIQFMNTGTVGIAPEIVLDSQMTITKGNDQFIVSAGKHTVDDFRFEIGMNTFMVTGNGNISFNWHKEVI